MILDGQLCFTAVPPGDTATTAAAQASSNVIDLHLTGIPSLASGVGARDWGIGDDPAIKILAMVATPYTSTTGSTMTVALQAAPDNGSGGTGTFVTWYSSTAFTTAQMAVQGARLLDMDLPRPPLGQPIPRFLRLLFTGAVGVFNTGQIFGALVIDRHDQVYQSTGNTVLGGYPAGVTVSN